MSAHPTATTKRGGLPTLLFGFTALTTHAATLYTDFGNADVTGNWNSISNAQTGSINDAIDSTGAATGIQIAVTSRFNGINASGTTDPTAPYPSFATQDSFFGNADAEFSEVIITSASVSISGLSSGFIYDFTFYASRVADDDRGTRYTVTGANSGFGELNPTGPLTETVSVNGISPDGSGVINLVVSEGPTNDNSFGFFYLGVMEMNSSPVPEPGSSLLFVATLGAAGLRRRR